MPEINEADRDRFTEWHDYDATLAPISGDDKRRLLECFAAHREAAVAEERERREEAAALCLAWQFVFDGITAHIRDRIAVGDPASPEVYLRIIQEDAAQVASDSRKFLAANRSRCDSMQETIDALRAEVESLATTTPPEPRVLTAEIVKEMLPLSPLSTRSVCHEGRWGEIEWMSTEHVGFAMQINGQSARLNEFTDKSFAEIVAALGISEGVES